MIVVSPGVYTREIDFSLYVPQLATSTLALIGTASKGPVNEITLITDEATMISTFGEPSTDHYAIYAALRYLRFGRQLKFVRVAEYDVVADGVIRNQGDTQDAVAVDAVSSGSWGNSITLAVAAGTDAGTYKIIVSYDGRVVEVFDLLKVGAAYESDANYIGTRINGVSEYISVTPDTSQTTLEVGTVTLTGGDDGAPVSDAAIIGTAGDPPAIPATGMQLFANPETVDINILAVPGNSHASVISAMITLCESRADTICLIDPPYGKSVQQAVTWMNGNAGGPNDPASAINSSYAACYYPWVQVYDGYTDSYVWIPPSGHVAGVMAWTDYVADPWIAPAGLNRAILRDVIDVEHSSTQGERDYMYANGNALNPIINYPNQGVVIWGQRTTQRAPTALDRVNVRRLLLVMRKQIATAVRYLVFEPNDEFTWRQFINLVEPVCRDIVARRGIYDFRVVCDETTNTQLRIDRNEMHGKIFLKPTKTAEMIIIDFVILANQAQFEEFTGA